MLSIRLLLLKESETTDGGKLTEFLPYFSVKWMRAKRKSQHRKVVEHFRDAVEVPSLSLGEEKALLHS